MYSDFVNMQDQQHSHPSNTRPMKRPRVEDSRVAGPLETSTTRQEEVGAALLCSPPNNIKSSQVNTRTSTLTPNQTENVPIRDTPTSSTESGKDSKWSSPKTQDQLDSSLQALEQAVSTSTAKAAYDLAVATNPQYVGDPSFRLSFLRANRFDIQQAAAQLVNHFQTKLDLFGPELLTQDITTDTLTKDDRACLETGWAQWARAKDASGRRVAVFLASRLEDKHWKHACRAIWYLLMSSYMVDSEEAQRIGLAVVFYLYGKHVSQPDVTIAFDLWKGVFDLIQSVPVAVDRVHYCSSGPTLHPDFQRAVEVTGVSNRVMCENNFGTPVQCAEYLHQHGIPKTVLPIEADGTVHLSNFPLYWAERQAIELTFATKQVVEKEDPTVTNGKSPPPKQQPLHVSSLTSSKGAVVPRPEDVLMSGRGKQNIEHQGNMLLSSLVETNRARYDDASKFEKTVVAQLLVGYIKDAGGRFLKRELDGTWMEVDDDIARDKVSHSFRNNRRFKATRTNLRNIKGCGKD